MNLKNLEQAFLESFSKLSISPLGNLNPDVLYSYEEKQTLIKNVEKKIGEFKEKGILEVKIAKSKCHFCYPNATAYCIYDNEYNFLTKYVMDQNGPEDFVFEECKNKPIPNGNDGYPF